MNLQEAYEHTMGVIRELEHGHGIEARIKESRSRESESVIERYGHREDRLPVNQWYHVTFYPDGDAQKQAVHEAAKHLGWRGIGFDTGGCAGQRDWEIDWSFCVDDVPDADREASRDAVEDVISGSMEAGG